MKDSLLCCLPKNKSKAILLLFLLGVVGSLLIPNLSEVRVWLLLFLIFLYLLFLVWASANIRSGVYVKSWNRGAQNISKVALTFDDGPDVQSEEILVLLKEWRAKATFFLIGSKIENQKDVVVQMLQEGHKIGNHTWSHSSLFPMWSKKKVSEELRKSQEALQKVSGDKNLYFRPPFGVTNPIIARVIKEMGLKVIGWSIRSLDTKNEDTEVVLRRIQSKVKGGDVILLHDTSSNVVSILEQLLPWLHSEGYEIVTVEELMSVQS